MNKDNLLDKVPNNLKDRFSSSRENYKRIEKFISQFEKKRQFKVVSTSEKWHKSSNRCIDKI